MVLTTYPVHEPLPLNKPYEGDDRVNGDAWFEGCIPPQLDCLLRAFGFAHRELQGLCVYSGFAD